MMEEKELLLYAYAILDDISPLYNNLEGMVKLKRHIKKEVGTIESLQHQKVLTEDHVKSSNLHHLHSIHNHISKFSNVISVMKKFQSKSDESVVVDIVANNGSMWYKIILRNPQALHLIFTSGSKKRIAPMNEVAEKYLRIAQENKILYSNPKVTFVFESGISSGIAKALETLGVHLIGEIIPNEILGFPETKEEESESQFENNSDHNLTLCENSNIISNETFSRGKMKSDNTLGQQYDAVNLDVTCLIAYCSQTSNGGCNDIFKKSFLNEQAGWERKCPVVPILDKYFAEKRLLLCKDACEHFKMILSTVGGDQEMERGLLLLDKCSIIDSQDLFAEELFVGGRIKSLSRKIFGTGYFHKAPTITANQGFLRASEQKGIKLAALLHQPRALTELKREPAKENS